MADKDEMLQIDLCDGQVRVMLCETTDTVQRCADIHGCTPVCTAALGRLLTGGVMIGACFMATDYVTSPITAKGKLVFGFGCGLLCMLIRQFGAYPEGCSFAILIMNALCPLVNRWTQPRPFGAK